MIIEPSIILDIDSDGLTRGLYLSELQAQFSDEDLKAGTFEPVYWKGSAHEWRGNVKPEIVAEQARLYL